MKLNAEISAASEHWEQQYNIAKEDNENDRELANQNFDQLTEAHE